jgi:hypothetical protein
MIALETKYLVRTQVDSSVVAERFPAICGKATFATEVSRTTMKVASITEIVIIHGLAEGLHPI